MGTFAEPDRFRREKKANRLFNKKVYLSLAVAMMMAVVTVGGSVFADPEVECDGNVPVTGDVWRTWSLGCNRLVMSHWLRKDGTCLPMSA